MSDTPNRADTPRPEPADAAAVERQRHIQAAALDAAAGELQGRLQVLTADPACAAVFLKCAGWASLFPDAPIYTFGGTYRNRPAALLWPAKTWKRLLGDRRHALVAIKVAAAADWLGDAWPSLDDVEQPEDLPDCLRVAWLCEPAAEHARLNRADVCKAYHQFVERLTAGLKATPALDKQAAEPVTESTPPAAANNSPLSTVAELAKEVGQPRTAVESFLRRYRVDYPDCCIENEGRRRRRKVTEAKYLYRRADVVPVLQEHFKNRPAWRK